MDDAVATDRLDAGGQAVVCIAVIPIITGLFAIDDSVSAAGLCAVIQAFVSLIEIPVITGLALVGHTIAAAATCGLLSISTAALSLQVHSELWCVCGVARDQNCARKLIEVIGRGREERAKDVVGLKEERRWDRWRNTLIR